jgi:excisionase family DNA binding protein
MEQQEWTITIPEAAERLGIHRDSAYTAAARGQIPTIRIGKRLLVPTAAFERMLGIEPGKSAARKPRSKHVNPIT